MYIMFNVFYVVVTAIIAIYLVPFLIVLIASGLFQLAFVIVFFYCLVKMIQGSKPRDFDNDR